MFVEGVVTDLRGNHIPNATIDTWETDGNGQYDNQVRDKTCSNVNYSCKEKKRHLIVWIKRGTWLSRETPFNRRWFIRIPCCGVSGLLFFIFKCEIFTIYLLNLLGLSRILYRMMVLSGKWFGSSEGMYFGLLTCTFASMFVTLLFTLSYTFPSSSTYLFFCLQAPGYEELITALYFKGPYITSDAVFGVKSSLIVVSLF